MRNGKIKAKPSIFKLEKKKKPKVFTNLQLWESYRIIISIFISLAVHRNVKYMEIVTFERIEISHKPVNVL